MTLTSERPSRPLSQAILLVMAISFGSAAWFVVQGVQARISGPRELAEELLNVKAKDGLPLDFELKNLKGEDVKLSSLSNKTVFLNFWATWCPPCIEEMPSLRRLYKKFEDHPDFVFLAVSTDQEWQAVRRFFEREPADFPVLLDAEGQIARRYGTTKFPETYIIDHGRLVGHIVGPRDWDHWYAEAWLRALLDSRS